MEKTAVYVRGQVWYWEDPIYGKKKEGNIPDNYEATLRYSRYVILAEDETVCGSILVIPCSSTSKTNSDVFIPISHAISCHDDITYARVHAIFPVETRSLLRYVCTLSDSVMIKIESEIIKKYVPTLCKYYNDEGMVQTLYQGCGIDLTPNKKIVELYKTPNVQLEKNVKAFIDKHIIFTNNYTDSISLDDIRDAYIRFSAANGLKLSEVNMIDFIDVFRRAINSSRDPMSHGYQYSINGWKYMKLSCDQLPESIPNSVSPRVQTPVPVNVLKHHDVVMESNTPQTLSTPIIKTSKRPGRRSTTWTTEKITEFLNDYDTRDINEVMDKYSIGKNTAYKYKHKWKDLLSGKNNKSKKGFTIDNIPSTDNAIEAVSKLSNMIVDYFRGKTVYQEVRDYHSSKNAPNMLDFYKKLDGAVYYSLIEMLDISVDPTTKKYSVPNIDSCTPYVRMWDFLDKIYNDPKISKCDDIIKAADMYNKRYKGKGKGIDPNWLNLLQRKLTNRMNISPEGISKINDIASSFCG